jgi:hypothetical protein
LIHCSSCENQTSITGGTIFQGTRKPLLETVLILLFNSVKHQAERPIIRQKQSIKTAEGFTIMAVLRYWRMLPSQTIQQQGMAADYITTPDHHLS